MKKHAFLVVLLSSLILTACNTNQPSKTDGSPSKADVTSQDSGSSSSTDDRIPVTVDEDLGEFDIHTDLMKQYLADDWDSILDYVPWVSADSGSSSHRSEMLGDASQPNPVALDFDEVEVSDKYYVEISKDLYFDNTKIYETNARTFDFYNAELGQQYYFRAAPNQQDLADGSVKAFKVKEGAPRNIHVDGVINFRDCGGWSSSLVEGAKVKQGMYYRCAQFNSGNTKNITAEGMKAIKDLNIKVDIDMRDSYNVPSTSPINSDDHPVEIFKGSVASGTENVRWEGSNGIAETYKAIFEAIAVADEKPIALHCTHGADRTGIVSWFLLGLLGVSKDDCSRDYVMTRFAGERSVLPFNDTRGSSEIVNWNAKTEALAGDTWAEKTYKHLHDDFNISDDTLETIREKFIPGYIRAA